MPRLLSLACVFVFLLVCCGKSQSNPSKGSFLERVLESRATIATAKSSTHGPLLEAIKIGLFNGKVFGKTKMKNPYAANIIAKIVRRFDIMLLMEVRDISGQSLNTLLSLVNTGATQYQYVTSDRLGRGAQKEQYAFFYRKDHIAVEHLFQFHDIDDVFEREPFTASFRVASTSIGLMAIHVKPKDAVQELDHLDDAFDVTKGSIDADLFFILGDLNADCDYLSDQQYRALELVTRSDFKWLISRDTDTTVSKTTNCSYDHVIAMSERASPRAEVFDFQNEFYLSDQQSMAVSDHYPIDLLLKL